MAGPRSSGGWNAASACPRGAGGAVRGGAAGPEAEAAEEAARQVWAERGCLRLVTEGAALRTVRVAEACLESASSGSTVDLA